MCSDGDAHRAIDTREFLDRDHVLHIAQSGATIFSRKDRAHHSHLAQFLNDFHGVMTGFVPLHHVGTDLPFGKFADGFLELQLFVRKLKIQTASIKTAKSAAHRRKGKTNDYDILAIGSWLLALGSSTPPHCQLLKSSLFTEIFMDFHSPLNFLCVLGCSRV